mmetsp:Transcript_32745/g.79300  ORF Transcript_32745/g.79300 Transcript_32745/m.79300 type:complete len:212 (-) Transcript_32745:27-662(-)
MPFPPSSTPSSHRPRAQALLHHPPQPHQTHPLRRQPCPSSPNSPWPAASSRSHSPLAGARLRSIPAETEHPHRALLGESQRAWTWGWLRCAKASLGCLFVAVQSRSPPLPQRDSQPQSDQRLRTWPLPRCHLSLPRPRPPTSACPFPRPPASQATLLFPKPPAPAWDRSEWCKALISVAARDCSPPPRSKEAALPPRAHRPANEEPCPLLT